MATPADTWKKIADTAKNITLPSQLDARPSRLVIRTRIWPSGRIGVGTPTDSDLVIPQKFKVRSLLHDKLAATTIAESGGKYQVGDVQVIGISKRPSDDPTVGYTPEQLHPTIAADNIEVLYLIFGGSEGLYSFIDLDSERILSHTLTLRLRSGNNVANEMFIRIWGDSEATVEWST